MLDQVYFVVQCFYLALQILGAIFAPRIFKQSLKSLDSKTFIGKKTYREVVVGFLGAIGVALLQLSLYDHRFFRDLSLIDYSMNAFSFAILAAIGAIAGSVIVANFHRKNWPLTFEYTGAFVGAILLGAIVYTPSLKAVVVLTAISLAFDLFSSDREKRR